MFLGNTQRLDARALERFRKRVGDVDRILDVIGRGHHIEVEIKSSQNVEAAGRLRREDEVALNLGGKQRVHADSFSSHSVTGPSLSNATSMCAWKTPVSTGRSVDSETIAVFGRRNLTASLAIWAGYQLSLWHEIATWYGWASFEAFPERASAFSPEDLYSNLLGAKLVGPIISSGNGRIGLHANFDMQIELETDDPEGVWDNESAFREIEKHFKGAAEQMNPWGPKK